MSSIPTLWLSMALVMTPGCPDDERESEPAASDTDGGTAARDETDDPDAGIGDVAAEALLSELSEFDRMRICQALEDDYNRAISDDTLAQMRCLERVIPMTATGARSIDVPRCEDLLERCLAGETIAERGATDPELDWNLLECDDGRLTAALLECAATVAEFEACSRESVETADQHLREQDCQGLQDRLEMQASSVASVSDACAPLAEKCAIYP